MEKNLKIEPIRITVYGVLYIYRPLGSNGLNRLLWIVLSVAMALRPRGFYRRFFPFRVGLRWAARPRCTVGTTRVFASCPHLVSTRRPSISRSFFYHFYRYCIYCALKKKKKHAHRYKMQNPLNNTHEIPFRRNLTFIT